MLSLENGKGFFSKLRDHSKLQEVRRKGKRARRGPENRGSLERGELGGGNAGSPLL